MGLQRQNQSSPVNQSFAPVADTASQSGGMSNAQRQQQLSSSSLQEVGVDSSAPWAQHISEETDADQCLAPTVGPTRSPTPPTGAGMEWKTGPDGQTYGCLSQNGTPVLVRLHVNGSIDPLMAGDPGHDIASSLFPQASDAAKLEVSIPGAISSANGYSHGKDEMNHDLNDFSAKQQKSLDRLGPTRQQRKQTKTEKYLTHNLSKDADKKDEQYENPTDAWWTGVSKEFSASYKPTVEFPAGPLVVSLLGTAELTASLEAKPDWSAGLNAKDGANTEVSVFVGGKVGGKLAGGVGLGAGMAGIANAGVGGQVALNGNAQAGASLKAKAGTSSGLSASGDLGLDISMIGSVDLVPYISLQCIGKRFEYPVTLASYELLKWAPKLAGVEASKDGIQYKSLANTSDVTVNVPEFVQSGFIGSFVDWIGSLNEDNNAAAIVEELDKSGLLARMDASQKAELISKIMDGFVGEGHEGSVLKLIQSETDRAKREQLVISAYETEHGCPGKGDLDKALEWLRGSMDDRWFGDDNLTALNELFSGA